MYLLITDDTGVISVILSCVEHVDMKLCLISIFLPHFASVQSNLMALKASQLWFNGSKGKQKQDLKCNNLTKFIYIHIDY